MNEPRNTSHPTGGDRRDFLRKGVLAAGALSLGSAPWVAAQTVRGANGRVGVGFIGTGGRAQAHIDICLALKAQGRCETVAVCDVYGPRVTAAAQKTGGKIYRNHHELLADPRVDVVCIATPDRLHAAAGARRRPGGQGRLLREAADPLEPVRAGQTARRGD